MRDILPELNGKEYYDEIYRNYDIHFCQKEEINELVEFLQKYWRKNHIFTLSWELLDWQHYDKEEERYNFVIARHKKTKEIHSILGFVPSSQFDKNIKNMEIWPCIWKSRDDVKVKGLGIILYYYMKEHLPIETISILGISEIALSIYKHWNFETGKIAQYYILNPNMEKYNLLEGYEDALKCRKITATEDVRLSICSDDEYRNLSVDEEIFQKINKYKSKDYYDNRFLKHPIYQYQFLKIEKNQKLIGIFVVRKCGNGNAFCIRIVDYIGDIVNIAGVSEQIQKYLVDNDYEYIDFCVVGIEKRIMESAGFVNKDDVQKLIVPNYFEPFLMENIPLDYAFKTVVENAKAEFYKADADQDRPNML